MSADNWARCPRCWQGELARVAAALQALADSYGRVTLDEWEELRAATTVPAKENATFREDYEFYGAEQGKVIAVYAGSCSVCGLSHEFRASETFFAVADTE